MNSTTSLRSISCHFAALVGLLFFWVPSHAQINFQKSVTRAVVVGISKYEYISGLRFAHRDAEAFAEYLRSPAGGNVLEENIKLLTNEKATDAQIGSALYWLIAESQEGDQAIIYFSGHGDVEALGKAQSKKALGYLLAYNVGKYTYMAGGALPLTTIEWVITSLTEDKLAQVLLIADACHAGNLAGSAIGGSKLTALALATQFDNEVKILSCGADQVSHEGEDWGGGHSVFSYYLLEGLQGLADKDEDRRVSLREIESFLADSVRRATSALDRRQTPEVFGNRERMVAKVDAATLAALKQKYSPPKAESSTINSPIIPSSDSIILKLYHDFEEALRTGHLLEPELGSAYSIYQQIKDHASMRVYKNLMRNDLAAKFQDETQKAINDYLSADPREMRRRWGMDDSRYRLYPLYLEKAAELIGAQNIAFKGIKAKQYYFAGLNLRLKGERSKQAAEKDSLFNAAKLLQEKTIGLDSTAAYAYNELGLLARRYEKYQLSINHFNNAVINSPTWVLPWANLCGSYIEIGKIDSAELCGLMAISLDSTYALAHYNLGYVYLTKKEEQKATICFQNTLVYQTDYINAYYNLGLSYYDHGNYVEAEKMWVEYNLRNPNDPATLHSLGYVGIKLNKGLDQAEALFLKVISIDSSYSKVYIDLGKLYLDKNQAQLAEKWINKSLSLLPEDAEAYYYLAIAQQQSPTKAVLSLENAFKKGFKDYNKLMNEPKLGSLRKKTEFKNLVKVYFPGKS